MFHTYVTLPPVPRVIPDLAVNAAPGQEMTKAGRRFGTHPSAPEGHFGDDQAIVRARLERHAGAHAVDDDLLEQLERRRLVVVMRVASVYISLRFFWSSVLARLLHEVVEAVAGLACPPSSSREAARCRCGHSCRPRRARGRGLPRSSEFGGVVRSFSIF